LKSDEGIIAANYSWYPNTAWFCQQTRQLAVEAELYQFETPKHNLMNTNRSP